MKKSIVILFVLLGIFANVENVPARQSYRVGLDYGYEPFEFDNDGKPDGILVDILNAVAKEENLDLNIYTNNWGIVYSDLVAGKNDLICMFYSEDRASKFIVSNAFLNVTHAIYYLNGSKPIENISDLTGETVLVEISDLVQRQFKEVSPNSITQTVDNQRRAIELLIEGKFKYALLPKVFVYQYSKDKGLNNIIESNAINIQNRYTFAAMPGKEELILKINEGLNIIKEKGIYDKIYYKWYGDVGNTEKDLSKFFTILIVSILFVGIVFVVIILLNRTLKKQVEKKTLELSNQLAERIRIENELRISQFAVDHAVDCIYGLDRDANIIYANKSASDVLGYSIEELLKMNTKDIDPNFKPELWYSAIEQMKSKGHFDIVTKQITKDGRHITVEGNLYYLPIAETDYLYAIFRDVSHRIALEDELRASEEFFRSVFENSSAIMLISDPSNNFRFVKVNKAALDFYGYTLEEFLKLSVTDLNRLGNESAVNLFNKIKSVTAYVMPTTITHYLKDGTSREVNLTVSTILVDGKELVFTIVADETEKNTAIKHLEESEEKFFRAFMTSPDAISINRVSDGMYIDVNEGFLKILGYDRDEIIGKSLDDVDVWKNNKDRNRLVQLLSTHGEALAMEVKFVRKNGDVIFGLVSARIIEIKGEKCIISITRDITESKREEVYRNALYQISEAAISSNDFKSLCSRIHSIISELMPSNNFYIALYDSETQMFEYPYFVDEFDAPPKPIKRRKGLTELVIDTGETWLVDPDEFFRLAAQGRVENIGTPSIDWLGAPLIINEDIIGAIVVQSYTDGVRYHEDHKRILSFVSNQIALALSQKRIQYELILSNEMLENRVEERTSELRSANEELQAQIEERLRIENEIRESEERFRLMADSAPVMIWMTNSDGRLAYINEMWLKFTGKSFDFTISDNWMNDIHPDDLEAFEESYVVATSNRRGFEIKVRLKNSDGEYRYILLNASPRFFGAALFLGFIGSGIDITDLENSLAREKELNFMKTRFISTVSHEYRTPLTTILTSTYLIETLYKAGKATEATKFLERIQMSVKSMTELLDQVLTISRSDSGKLAFNPIDINLIEFLDMIVDEMRIYDKDKHRCNVSRAENLPLRVIADKNLLYQILINLMTNAVKYSPEGEEVSCKAELVAGRLRFTVADKGMGIPEEQLPHLFEPFFRASNVGAIQGTGLGLSIVKRCVDMCEGEIKVSSTVGFGTTFVVTVPVTVLS